jgi:hypothetical protein
MPSNHAGGMDTTRLAGTPTAVAGRVDNAGHAAAYLIRTGNMDLLEVLGLDGGAASSRRCQAPGCGRGFAPTGTGGKQVCCSRTCAAALAKAERQANRNERNAKANGNV